MTELVFILDRSGSMAGLEKDTVGGFNAMIEKQKKEPGAALVTTVLFDNESTVIHDRLPLENVPPLTEKEYFTRGCTALLDAVGGAIHHIGSIHKYARREAVCTVRAARPLGADWNRRIDEDVQKLRATTTRS